MSRTRYFKAVYETTCIRKCFNDCRTVEGYTIIMRTCNSFDIICSDLIKHISEYCITNEWIKFRILNQTINNMKIIYNKTGNFNTITKSSSYQKLVLNPD